MQKKNHLCVWQYLVIAETPEFNFLIWLNLSAPTGSFMTYFHLSFFNALPLLFIIPRAFWKRSWFFYLFDLIHFIEKLYLVSKMQISKTRINTSLWKMPLLGFGFSLQKDYPLPNILFLFNCFTRFVYEKMQKISNSYGEL